MHIYYKTDKMEWTLSSLLLSLSEKHLQAMKLLKWIRILCVGMIIAMIMILIPIIQSAVYNDKTDARGSAFWTDENIDSTQFSNPKEAMFMKQEARLKALKCVPKAGVFKIEDVIDPDIYKYPYYQYQDWQLSLVKYQKVVLYRCLPQYSYCEVTGTKCLPIQTKRKFIAAIFKLREQKRETIMRGGGEEGREEMSREEEGERGEMGKGKGGGGEEEEDEDEIQEKKLAKKEAEEEEEEEEEEYTDYDYEEIMESLINGTLPKIFKVFKVSVEEHVSCSCQCLIST